MSSSSPADPSGADVGVQELIDRLKSEGVQEGQQQAESLLSEAKKQAAEMVDAARAEADSIVKQAQQQAKQTETNGKLALALASRDARVQLKEQLEHEFRGWIGRQVQEQLDQPDFLADLIREMAVQAMASIGGGGDKQRDKPRENQGVKLKFLVAGEGTKSIDAFVKGHSAEMFRQGVSLTADRTLTHGFRVQIVDDDVEMNFTDEAVTAALMRFLAPKFRQQIGSVSEDA